MSDAKFIKKTAAAKCWRALFAINNEATGKAVKPAAATCRSRAHTLANNNVSATVGGITVHGTADVLNPHATQGLNLPCGSNAWSPTTVGTRNAPALRKTALSQASTKAAPNLLSTPP